MKKAFELAGLGRGRTSPNPLVGAVVVAKGKIVGQGYHRRAGEKHAEIVALEKAGPAAAGADLYVNLEPCSHYGRTPPCTEAIIGSGVRRVFVSTLDPNPRVNGRGVDMLRANGLDVRTGIMEDEARRLNDFYFKYITTGIPFVIMKIAVSIDGKIATRTSDSKWITNDASRERVHGLRQAVDAVMVGLGTVVRDDPLLNVRIKNAKAVQPKRIILDSNLNMPTDRRMFRETPKIETIIATTTGAPEERARKIEQVGCRIIRTDGIGRRVDLKALLAELGRRGITSILIEGGAKMFTSAIEEGIVDRVVAFIAPIIIGGDKALSPLGGRGAEYVREALRLKDVRIEILGDNVMVDGYL